MGLSRMICSHCKEELDTSCDGCFWQWRDQPSKDIFCSHNGNHYCEGCTCIAYRKEGME